MCLCLGPMQGWAAKPGRCPSVRCLGESRFQIANALIGKSDYFREGDLPLPFFAAVIISALCCHSARLLIWRREGPKVPKKPKPRGRLWLNDGSCVRLRPLHPTTCGAMLISLSAFGETDGDKPMQNDWAPLSLR